MRCASASAVFLAGESALGCLASGSEILFAGEGNLDGDGAPGCLTSGSEILFAGEGILDGDGALGFLVSGSPTFVGEGVHRAGVRDGDCIGAVGGGASRGGGLFGEGGGDGGDAGAASSLQP